MVVYVLKMSLSTTVNIKSLSLSLSRPYKLDWYGTAVNEKGLLVTSWSLLWQNTFRCYAWIYLLHWSSFFYLRKWLNYLWVTIYHYKSFFFIYTSINSIRNVCEQTSQFIIKKKIGNHTVYFYSPKELTIITSATGKYIHNMPSLFVVNDK